MQEIKFKTFSDNSLETDIHRKMIHERFWGIMKEMKFDVKRLVKHKTVLLEDIARFNIELNRLNMESQYPMMDMVNMLIDREGIPVRSFIVILDSENMRILKEELRAMFKFKEQKKTDIDYLVT